MLLMRNVSSFVQGSMLVLVVYKYPKNDDRQEGKNTYYCFASLSHEVLSVKQAHELVYVELDVSPNRLHLRAL